MRIPHHEFWPWRILEIPYYSYVIIYGILCGISPRGLLKANYQLENGGILVTDKRDVQQLFDQSYFPVSSILGDNKTIQTHEQASMKFLEFSHTHQFPIIIKPRKGMKGLGVKKINDVESLKTYSSSTDFDDMMMQAYCDHPLEFGISFYRKNKVTTLYGIVQKHFPSITGNGKNTMIELIRQHPRYSSYRESFLSQKEEQYILDDGEIRIVSHIGSHTLGCKFTDESELITEQLHTRLVHFLSTAPGYNAGRLDIKVANIEALQSGDFIVIEANGLSSQPTHMFDPSRSLRRLLKEYFFFGKQIIQIAKEHQDKPHPNKQTGKELLFGLYDTFKCLYSDALCK